MASPTARPTQQLPPPTLPVDSPTENAAAAPAAGAADAADAADATVRPS